MQVQITCKQSATHPPKWLRLTNTVNHGPFTRVTISNAVAAVAAEIIPALPPHNSNNNRYGKLRRTGQP